MTAQRLSRAIALLFL